MRRRTWWLLLAVLVALAGIAGCGADDDSADRSASDVGGASGGVAEEGGDADAEATGGGSDDLGAQAPPADDPARIVYTADVRVRVDDPAAAAREAIALVEAAGGSLANQSEVDGQDQVTVTVRVPVDGFRDALDALAGLGTVLDRQVDAQDVTDQVVDLEGRLENARASADRLRELYATATDVAQIVTIEQALTEREAEVESLAGQLQQLEDRANRSTVTATFVDEGEPVADEDDDANAFVRGLRAGRDLLVGLGTVVAALAGFLVPLSPFVLLLGVVALVARRRRRRRRASPGADTRPGPPSAPPTAPTSAPAPDRPTPVAPASPGPPPPPAPGTGWGSGGDGPDQPGPTPPS